VGGTDMRSLKYSNVVLYLLNQYLNHLHNLIKDLLGSLLLL